MPRKLFVLETCALVSTQADELRPLRAGSRLLFLVLRVLDEPAALNAAALATEPVKTPHFGPYRVLSGSH